MEDERMNEEELKDLHLPFFGIPKLLPYLKPYRKRIIGMILLGIAASLIDSIFPLFNRYAIDHFVAERRLIRWCSLCCCSLPYWSHRQ